MELMGWEFPAQGPADLAMGIVAFLVSLVLFLHPLPTFWKVWKTRKAGGLEPYPYMAVFINCFAVIMYSAARKSEVSEFKHGCLFYSSEIGLLVINLYVLIFVKFNEEVRMSQRCAIGGMYGVFLVLYTIPIAKERILGSIATVTGITMYMSPLFQLVHAYRTKRAECLPFWLCITFELYALAWTTYASLMPTFDFYFSVGNGIGTVLSFVQLGVCYALRMKFQNSYPSDSAGDDNVEKSRDGVDEPLLKRQVN